MMICVQIGIPPVYDGWVVVVGVKLVSRYYKRAT